MNRTTTPIALLVLFASACAGPPAESAGATATAGGERPSFTHAELGKFDEALVERLERADSERIPVMVRFVSMPSADELSELLLVRYDGEAIGNVDRWTLQQIARRDDVVRVSFVTGTRYSADDEEDSFFGEEAG